MPIFVSPRRCAEAMTIATLRYFTSLFGRRWISGCSAIAAAPRMRASSSGRLESCSPFQMMVPSKSISIVTTCGCVAGGGGVPTGMLSLTACVWIGMVMISMMSSTSITSMSGVVLMSTITSAWRCALPTVIAMAFLRSSAAARRRFGDEADLQDAGALAVVHHASDKFIASLPIAADMHLGLRLLHRDLLQPGEELPIIDELVVPEKITVAVDRDDNVLGLG